MHVFCINKNTYKLLIKMFSKSVMHAILTVIKIKYKYITFRSKYSHFVIIGTKSLETKRLL